MTNTLTETQHLLAVGWWIVVGFSVLLYIILDGADLGAGIFSLFVRDTDERGAIMEAMAGTWDANETWLIVAGGVLFGSFPFAYGSALHYLMIPLMMVLLGVLTRAVALEFRHLAATWSRRFTDYAFGLSSLVVTFFGGMGVGAVLQGFPMTHPEHGIPAYIGGALRFATPFSAWTGLAAVVAVSLSGGLFVRARFEKGEPIRRHARGWTHVSFYLVTVTVLITVIWSALIFPWAWNNWTGHYFWAWGLVLAAALFSTYRMRVATFADRDFRALLWLDATIAIMMGGMLATMYPYIVPGTWTVYDAASPEISVVTFLLTAAGLFPVMIMYNWYQIWVFRARVAKMVSH